jgi:uncharacterized membrane protein
MSLKPEKSSVLETLERLLLPGCAVAALVLGVVGMGRFLRLDEANSVLIASSNLSRVIEYLHNDNNLPVYYLLLHGWIRLAGISESAVHVPSVVFYWLAIAVAYNLGREVSGEKLGGLYTGLFYLASFQAVHHAQTARMYSLLGLLAALSTLFFMRIWFGSKAEPRDWILYLLVNAVGCLTHVWYFFLLFGQAICGLALQPKKVRTLAGAQVASAAPFLLLWARYLGHQARIGAAGWMPRARREFFVGVFSEFYGGVKWGSILLAAVLVICLVGVKREAIRQWLGRKEIWALATIAVVSVLVPLLISYVYPIYWPGRYTMIALPAFAAALGSSVARLTSRGIRVTFAYAVLLSVLAFQVHNRRLVFENSVNVTSESDSDKPAALALCQWARPGDTLLFTGLSRAGVEYYLRRLECGQDLVLTNFPEDTAEHMGWVRNADSEDLRTEADAIARRFSEGPGDHKLWVTLAYGRTNDKVILTEMLNRRLRLTAMPDLHGSFFDGAMVFARDDSSGSATLGSR